jgi:hypothetical protein
MIDKLSLTTSQVPDLDYLESHARIKRVDEYRMKLYKFVYELERSTVFCMPHKFADNTNARIPFTKIDVNPKNFVCLSEFESYLKILFDNYELIFDSFNVSRIDIAADTDIISVNTLLSVMNVKHIRSESFQVYKGTIYAGTDPKIRIYDKVKEIKARKKNGRDITEYEQALLDSGKNWTRFEIQIRGAKKNLREVLNDPFSFVSYFDRMEIIKNSGDDTHGIMQFLYRFINRKFRKEIESLKNNDLIEVIKDIYISSVTEWLREKEPF